MQKIIFGISDRWKGIGWKDVVAGIFIPLLAAFPWIVEIGIVEIEAPTKVQNYFLPSNGDLFVWIWFALCYLAYFALRGTGRLFFNIFAYASFAASLMAFALVLFIGEEYHPVSCIGLIYDLFGWSLGCNIENFLLIFIVDLFLISVFVFRRRIVPSS